MFALKKLKYRTMFECFIYAILDKIEDFYVDLRDSFLNFYIDIQERLRSKLKEFLRDNEEVQVEIDYRIEEIFWLMREYLSLDSQFTQWIVKAIYNFLGIQERKFFRKLYKKKLKLKKQIEKKQKELERIKNDTNMER